ncbi:MAG TPA: Sir2 family NAD-dependent protein deacetylase [Bacillota bacterium]|nr:Sir2 family NAD-dependent protein deacetylase [Bacillota bacterium]
MKQRIVAFTGAGVSKGSGIPTFEDLPGIRDYLTRDYFQREPGGFYEKVWALYRRIQAAPPNPAHLALAQNQIPVVTMNVDGLHRRAGTRELVEIHGNLDWVSCPECGKREPFSVIESRFHCQECGRVLEPNVVLYGDMLIELPTALQLVVTAELLLVIGTSFSTSTAGYIVDYARAQGCRVEVINQDAEHKVPDFLGSFQIQ